MSNVEDLKNVLKPNARIMILYVNIIKDLQCYDLKYSYLVKI